MSNLLLSVMGTFAEFERSIIKERQMEGIALAKKRSVYEGRKKALNQEQIEQTKVLLNNEVPEIKRARKLNISKQTLYKYLKI